ncbi:putative HEAT repeat-containing domain protein [Trichinella spiralis]|uniref:putative HEAT repeat-containing domain protein n=1 Tax=Trichinella spiralis TaxID=6334 RepID=UPI0001EFF024|nr:putative HEAT repeat-containing domain protein [Trichinella spiralis]
MNDGGGELSKLLVSCFGRCFPCRAFYSGKEQLETCYSIDHCRLTVLIDIDARCPNLEQYFEQFIQRAMVEIHDVTKSYSTSNKNELLQDIIEDVSASMLDEG